MNKIKILATFMLSFVLLFSSPLTISVTASDLDAYRFANENDTIIRDGIEYKVSYIDYKDVFNEEEIKILQKLTMAEAGNQSKECQRMVAETVLNRVGSKLYPNTIKDVVFQVENDVYQFSCVPDGNYAKAVPTEQVIQAVDEALFNYVNEVSPNPSDMLYFNSIYYFDWARDYKQVGAMYFSLQEIK